MSPTHSPAAPRPPSVSPSRRRQWSTVLVLCAAQVLIVLEQNIVNIALPDIQDDLGFSAADLVWTVNAYVVPFGGLLLLAGRLGDLISRRRVFLTGLSLFVLASLWCGLAENQSVLLVARFVQGIGGAVTAAGLLGMVVAVFVDPRDRARAIGVFGFASAGGSALGLVVGGMITHWLSWQWIFLINLPLGGLVLAFAFRLLPRDRGQGWSAGIDALGAVLATVAIMTGVYTLIGIPTQPVSATLVGSAVTFGALAGFGWRQARAATPLIPARVWRAPNVVAANLVQALMTGGLFAFLFFTVLQLQQVWHYGPFEAGIAFLPAPTVIAVVSLWLVPRLLARFPARAIVLTGLPILLIGFLLFTRISVAGDYLTSMLPSMIMLAFGFSITMPALMSLGMSAVPDNDAGTASGLFSTTQQVGGAVGLAVLTTVAAARTDAVSADGGEAAFAAVSGYRLGFLIAAGMIGVAVILAATLLTTRGAEPAQAETEQPVS
ncbi:EmrB/QacA subfamily drug resistance transporter [Stackebrandtia endophytica]|uniref:EmrB/QacA subfamily drug resistance transporter n=1 Tax=Stackebrandtia endophytica TaxID=1496996 RepID=A0A543B3I0_9ACTN|nr:MFS transporter [Stackebrandtia endophytica]TQL79397.1 EmrB/QacA subfamily drug resistance transporter [Stackebrandtia endophytica]